MRTSPLAPWIARKIGAQGPSFDRADLERYQLDRLRSTITLARNRSRLYRERLAAAPDQPATLDRLAEYPFTTARDVRDHPLHLLCVPQDEINRVVTLDTSGTTGQPKRLYFTASDQELTTDFFQIGMSTFTQPGDTVLILLPCERPGSVGDLLATGLERLGARPLRHGVVQDVDETLAVIERERVDGMVGIPTQVLGLARYGPGARLRSVLLSTDHVPFAAARAVEQAWGCQVYNHYGMTEMGLGGGVECEAHRGYHLREADLLVEVADPRSGRPVPDGEEGEVVFTTLTRAGMPLIRYRTGDLSRFLPGPCPCGAPLRTLQQIRTRLAGLVTIGPPVPGSTQPCLTMADLDDALFAVDGMLDFTASISADGGQDRLEVVARVTKPAEPVAAQGSEGVSARIRDALASVPAVRRASAAGHLLTTVTVQPTRSVTARPIKRSIEDVRTHA